MRDVKVLNRLNIGKVLQLKAHIVTINMKFAFGNGYVIDVAIVNGNGYLWVLNKCRVTRMRRAGING